MTGDISGVTDARHKLVMCQGVVIDIGQTLVMLDVSNIGQTSDMSGIFDTGHRLVTSQGG